MNKQSYAVSFVDAAKKSGRREAEVRERSKQIFDYYRRNRSGKVKK